MNDSNLVSISQIEEFLKTGQFLSFKSSPKDKESVYRWIEFTLVKFSYFSIRKKEKTSVKKYLQSITGYSDSQITKLIGKKEKLHSIRLSKNKRNTFQTKYSTTDIALLIKVDKAHEKLSGPSTKKILEREYLEYGKEDYKNISNISSSHIYNLRTKRQYKSEIGFFEKTKPVSSQIGLRCKPNNEGKPGYIRVDTVHQGDILLGEGEGETKKYKKGVYHINLVDEVTQWELVGSVQAITENFLVPLLKQLIEQFPFKIINFHSDNGSEYINKIVASMLNKFLIHQTKSRPRHSNDNGLVETKNGSVIRKYFGYGYIPQAYANEINTFYKNYFNPYLNFHRPSGFPTRVEDPKKKGKYKNVYNTYMTPFQKLQLIPDVHTYLKTHVTISLLQQFEKQLSDTEAAEEMQRQKLQLLKSFRTNPTLT